ncbi:glycosyl transferase [Plantactinospora mayteni]
MSGPGRPAETAPDVAVPAAVPAATVDSWRVVRRTAARLGARHVSRLGALRAWSTRRRGGLVDAAVVLLYLAAAGHVTSGLWLHRDRMTNAGNDMILFEWMLARAARAVTHLENPFYSTALNAPDGINLMANTSVLGLGVPLTPVTLLLGSQHSYLLAVVLSLAGTATAWYLFLSRRLVRSRLGAAVSGLFCGFAPGMISQATGHLHMIAQFLVPAILAVVFDRRTDRVLRRGVLLGVLVGYQVFLGEEVLAFLVLACGVFTVGYAVSAPRNARRLAPAFLGRLGVGTGVGVVLLAYPLWFQFFGPGHYRGLPFDPKAYPLDLASFTAASRQSITGHESVPGMLSPNLTEENSFFGLALIVLCAVVAIWLWRRPLVRALVLCVLIFAALSLGENLRLGGEVLDLPGPYRLVSGVPLIDLAVPARFPLICVPALAILLALSFDEVFRRGAADGRTGDVAAAGGGAVPVPGAGVAGGRVPIRLLWTGAVVAVLLPLAPTPLHTRPVWPVPDFVANGEWRSYVPPGRTLVAVPPTRGSEGTAGMYWSARTGLDFTAPGGYFIGPTGPDDPQARWGAPDRPTAILLDRVAATGEVPSIGDVERRQAIEDLRHWRAAIVVQGGLHRGVPVKETLDQLLGPGRDISGAWVWDVRALVD